MIQGDLRFDWQNREITRLESLGATLQCHSFKIKLMTLFFWQYDNFSVHCTGNILCQIVVTFCPCVSSLTLPSSDLNIDCPTLGLSPWPIATMAQTKTSS